MGANIKINEQGVPQISPEQWQMGMSLFQQFLKKVRIEREGNLVHIDWIFEFPDENMAKIFVKQAKVQFGSATD